jgi:alkanesulfonate monooxygenase SsuD/methylene tetrahydromethanopterin reductase-like flavin-dependent oxidoreductase (luciferase family)
VLRALESSIADMERRRARNGRKIRYAINPFLALGKSSQDALDRAMQQIFATDPVGDTRKIESRMIPATRAGFIGTPLDVRKQVRRFADMGFDLLLLKMIASVEAVEEVGAEIIATCGSSATSQELLTSAV